MLCRPSQPQRAWALRCSAAAWRCCTAARCRPPTTWHWGPRCCESSGPPVTRQARPINSPHYVPLEVDGMHACEHSLRIVRVRGRPPTTWPWYPRCCESSGPPVTRQAPATSARLFTSSCCGSSDDTVALLRAFVDDSHLGHKATVAGCPVRGRAKARCSFYPLSCRIALGLHRPAFFS